MSSQFTLYLCFIIPSKIHIYDGSSKTISIRSIVNGIPEKVTLLVYLGIDLLYNAFLEIYEMPLNKGNNKITELRTILQRESQNS